MLRLVALVRADVLEERIASFIRVTRIGKLGATLAITNNRSTLQLEGGEMSLRNVGSYKSHTA
jgi:hypothetical protein